MKYKTVHVAVQYVANKANGSYSFLCCKWKLISIILGVLSRHPRKYRDCSGKRQSTVIQKKMMRQFLFMLG